MAKLGTITFTGKSGTKYEFGVYPWGTSFNKDFSAVYCVTRRTQNPGGWYSHTQIYVGQTGYLSTRFDKHHKQSCFDEHNKDCVCVYGEQDEETRLEIEQDLIDNYHPTCNGD